MARASFTMATVATTAALLLSSFLLPAANAQPFVAADNGLGPLGNLRTTDRDGPYNVSLLGTQIAELSAGGRARKNFTDKDIIDFLVNAECLEGQFDTWGTFGFGFVGNLTLGGPPPIGARKAKLTERTRSFLEEVALNEQGHALLTRQLGGVNPCPPTNPTAGLNELLALAFGVKDVKRAFGEYFDPYANDQNFVLSVLTFEELGATGNKGLAGLVVNPVHAAAISGLATSATAQATVERFLLYELRREIIHPFKETAQQVFARISAVRDALDGPQFDDQGIVNTDPRFLAVPDHFVNLIPTDVRGITLARTPPQVLHIAFAGGITHGGAFPYGVYGKINSADGYNLTLTDAQLVGDSDGAPVAKQESAAAVGKWPPPITAAGPKKVEGELQLTQALGGPLATATYKSRGYDKMPRDGRPNTKIYSDLAVGTEGGKPTPDDLTLGDHVHKYGDKGTFATAREAAFGYGSSGSRHSAHQRKMLGAVEAMIPQFQ